MQVELTQRQIFILMCAITIAQHDLPDDVKPDEVQAIYAALREKWTLK